MNCPVQVCEELRKDYPDGLPVIMLSANGDEGSILRGLQVGITNFDSGEFYVGLTFNCRLVQTITLKSHLAGQR